MSDPQPESFAPPSPVPPGPPAQPEYAAAPASYPPPYAGAQPGYQPPPYQVGLPSRPVNRMATAAYVITSVNVVMFLVYRLLNIADFAANSQGFDIFYCVIGCIAIVPFVTCVVFGHLGMAAGRRLGGVGRGPAGFALGVGYLSIMLWLTALASAIATMIMNGSDQPFYESFYI